MQEQARVKSSNEVARLFNELCCSVTPDNLSFLKKFYDVASAIQQCKKNGVSSPSFDFPGSQVSPTFSPAFDAPGSGFNLPCFQPGKGKVELALGTGVYINRNARSSISAAAGNDSHVLTRELYKELLGESLLLSMSAKGQKKKSKSGELSTNKGIPPLLYRVVYGYVCAWIEARNTNKENPPPKAIQSLSDMEYMRVVNLYCGRLRKAAKGEVAFLDSPAINTRSSAKKRKGLEDETDKAVGAKRSLNFDKEHQESNQGPASNDPVIIQQQGSPQNEVHSSPGQDQSAQPQSFTPHQVDPPQHQHGLPAQPQGPATQHHLYQGPQNGPYPQPQGPHEHQGHHAHPSYYQGYPVQPQGPSQYFQNCDTLSRENAFDEEWYYPFKNYHSM